MFSKAKKSNWIDNIFNWKMLVLVIILINFKLILKLFGLIKAPIIDSISVAEATTEATQVLGKKPTATELEVVTRVTNIADIIKSEIDSWATDQMKICTTLNSITNTSELALLDRIYERKYVSNLKSELDGAFNFAVHFFELRTLKSFIKTYYDL